MVGRVVERRAALAALTAVGWMLLRGRSELDAAMEIDRRFGLKERVASSLSLPPEALASPAGQALVRDAERAIRRIEIGERFRVHMGRRTWLPLAPALVSLVLTLFVNNQPAVSSATAVAALNPQALAVSTQALRKRLTEIAKQDPKKGLKDTQALLLEMERELERLAATPRVDRKQALVRFNNLSQQLAERRDRLGGDKEMRRQLAALKDLGRGPADKMLKSMQTGDWDAARQELQKLQDQLKTGKVDAAIAKQLAEQLKQLEQRLSESAAQRRQAIDNLKQQVDAAKRDGDLAKAGELQEKLEKLQRQQKAASQLSQMAAQLSQAREQLERGNQQAAAEAMQQLGDQLESLQSQSERDAADSAMLTQAMDELQSAKDSMLCEACQGAGCELCQGHTPGKRSSAKMAAAASAVAARSAVRRKAPSTARSAIRKSSKMCGRAPRSSSAKPTGQRCAATCARRFSRKWPRARPRRPIRW